MVKVMATAAEQEKQKKAKEYEKYVKQVTPTHSLFKNMCRAFLCGGAICVLGAGNHELLHESGTGQGNQRRLDFPDPGAFKCTLYRI